MAAALCAASFAGGQLLLGEEESSSGVIWNEYQKTKQAVAAPPLVFPAPTGKPVPAPVGILNPFVSSQSERATTEKKASVVQLVAHSVEESSAAQRPDEPTLIEARPLPLDGVHGANPSEESRLPPIIPASLMPARPARKGPIVTAGIQPQQLASPEKDHTESLPPLEAPVLLESKFHRTTAVNEPADEPPAELVTKTAARPGSWIDDLRQVLGGQSRQKSPDIQQATALSVAPPAPTVAAPEKEKLSMVEANNPLRTETRPSWERVGIRSAQSKSEPTPRASLRRKSLPSPWSTLKAWERAKPVAEGE